MYSLSIFNSLMGYDGNLCIHIFSIIERKYSLENTNLINTRLHRLTYPRTYVFSDIESYKIEWLAGEYDYTYYFLMQTNRVDHQKEIY